MSDTAVEEKKSTQNDPFNEASQEKSSSPKGKPKSKQKYPAVKRSAYVNFNPEGNAEQPAIALALSQVTSSGRLDLLIFPESGGEVIRKNGVPHESEFGKIENVNVRKHGSWGKIL